MGLDQEPFQISKEVVKEAIKEWLDDRAADVGWWGIKSVAYLAVAGLLVLILWSQGWHK